MTKYISKAAVVAEIEKRIKKYATIDVGNSSELDALYGAKCHALKSVLTFLDTIETKEVDLEEEIDKELDEEWYGEYINLEKFKKSAKHFFELGLRAKEE